MVHKTRAGVLLVTAVVVGAAAVHCGSTEATVPDAVDSSVPTPAQDSSAPDTTPQAPMVDAAACPAGQQVCNSVCTNTTVDPSHCGGCGTPCATGLVCSAGKCAVTCQGGLSLCTPQPFVVDGGVGDGGVMGEDAGPTAMLPRCVDRQNDDQHCGACNIVCGASESCSGGSCKTFPSCAALALAKSPLPDGRYTIKPGDAGKAFTVYCSGMSTGSPKEYIDLPAYNHVAYGGGGACACGAPFTRVFSKVRINPDTLVIDRSDFTFTSVSGPLACWAGQAGACGTASTLAYGGAANCNGTQAAAGTASINLTGTEFSVAVGVTWVPDGFNPYGTTTVDGARKVIDITGGGFCGTNFPTSAITLVVD